MFSQIKPKPNIHINKKQIDIDTVDENDEIKDIDLLNKEIELAQSDIEKAKLAAGDASAIQVHKLEETNEADKMQSYLFEYATPEIHEQLK